MSSFPQFDPSSSESFPQLTSGAEPGHAPLSDVKLSTLNGEFIVSAGGDGHYTLRDSLNLDHAPRFAHRVFSLIGLRLGDEGKGRAIPELITILRAATGLDNPVMLVGKVNGGANSGHSVEVLHEGERLKLGLNLIPTGVVETGVAHLALGGGVLADPFKLSVEGDLLESYGLGLWNRLLIDLNTMVADISHRIRDLAREESRPDKRGSTGRGISPGYEDEVDFACIRWDVFRSGNKAEFVRLMEDRLQRCCRRVQHEYGMSPERWHSIFEELSAKEIKANQAAIGRGLFTEADFDLTRFRGNLPFTFDMPRMIEEYWAEGCKRVQAITDVGERVQEILDGTNGHVVFEHGQALALDKRNGTSRSRTASHTGSAEVFTSFRLPVTTGMVVLGTTKAYETAVGNHDFPTKMDPEHPLALKLMPMEKGVTTGRQRDVGFYDAVQIAHSLRTHGCNFIVFNKIDELGYAEPWSDGNLKICVGYRMPDGRTIQHVPHDSHDRESLSPVYLELPGWQEDLKELRSFADWPQAAKEYLATCVVASVLIAQRGLKHPPPPPQVLFAGVGPAEGQIVNDVPSFADLLKYARPLSTEPSS